MTFIRKPQVNATDENTIQGTIVKTYKEPYSCTGHLQCFPVSRPASDGSTSLREDSPGGGRVSLPGTGPGDVGSDTNVGLPRGCCWRCVCKATAKWLSCIIFSQLSFCHESSCNWHSKQKNNIGILLLETSGPVSASNPLRSATLSPSVENLYSHLYPHLIMLTTFWKQFIQITARCGFLSVHTAVPVWIATLQGRVVECCWILLGCVARTERHQTHN